MTEIIVAVLVVILVAGVVIYNRLIRGRNRVSTAWSDIDVQLQRRHDLIPRLVKAVDQYASYERATLEAVTELRAEAMQQADVRARGAAEEKLSAGIERLLALAESYPDLKANENFLARTSRSSPSTSSNCRTSWSRPRTICSSRAVTTMDRFAITTQ